MVAKDEPALLLIDSPAIGLASAIVDEVYETITNLHARGLSSLFIEQNADLRGSRNVVDAYFA